MKTNTILIILLLTTTLAQGQVSSNCLNAAPATLGINLVDTIQYTNPTQPLARKAKWFKYTPIQDGIITVESCLQGKDTRLTLHAGRCDSLVKIGFSDDDCPINLVSSQLRASSISKSVTANANYWIEWDNAWDSSRFNFTLAFTPRASIAGDNCNNPLNLPLSQTRIDSFTGYSPSHVDARKALWYRFAPQIDGKLSVISCNGGADTRLWIYKGPCQNLALQTSADNTCPMNSADMQNRAASIVNFQVTSGSIYFIEWDNANSSAPFDFNASFIFVNATNEQNELQNAIKIYPNPATDHINIDFELPTKTQITIKITNILGETIQTQSLETIQNQTTQINLPSQISTGIYNIQFQTSTGNLTKKLFISK
jgi:hypothetical protein